MDPCRWTLISFTSSLSRTGIKIKSKLSGCGEHVQAKWDGYTLNMSEQRDPSECCPKRASSIGKPTTKTPTSSHSSCPTTSSSSCSLCLCDPDVTRRPRVTVEIEQLRKICESQNDDPSCVSTPNRVSAVAGGIFDDKALFLNFETAGAQVSNKKLTVSVLKNKNTDAQLPLLDAYLTSQTTIAAQEVCGFKLMVLGKGISRRQALRWRS